MEIQVAASAVGKKKFYIDLTNWGRVERYHRPFLVNAGWPGGLATGVLDLRTYMEEVAEIYREAVDAVGRANRNFIKTAGRLWLLRFVLPTRVEVAASAVREARAYWEIKTHVENVLGKRFDTWGEVYTGRAGVEVRNGAVYVGGAPSLGHTYLWLIGALSL